MLDNEDLAKKMYDAYCDGVGGIAFNGDKLPSSDEFFKDESKLKQRTGWIKAADVVIDLLCG